MKTETPASDPSPDAPRHREPPPRSDLVLDAEGRWLSDGVVVTHRGILDALHAGLRRELSGEFTVQIGWQKALVTVEGAPFFVRSIRFSGTAAPRIALLDESDHDLDPGTLTMGADDALFCVVRGERARFLPAAMHQMAEHLVERGDDLYLSLGGIEYPVRSSKAGTASDHP